MAQAILLPLYLPLAAGRYTRGNSVYAYDTWSTPILTGACSNSSVPLSIPIRSTAGHAAALTCFLRRTSDLHGSGLDGASTTKAYRFPQGIFEIGLQFLVPSFTEIVGAADPNDFHRPTISPNWTTQTLFLATRGATNYSAKYCFASDMVHTRVGFVLSSFVAVRNISFQGLDTIRPEDNGALCGGGAFETKGCAGNSCQTLANNGGSDGLGSQYVTLENVRLNDFFPEDRAKVGQNITGNYNCRNSNWKHECCFCKPNGIRASQVAFWIPETRDPKIGTRNIIVRNLVSMATQADGINLHGYVRDTLIENTYVASTGDDGFALWGASRSPENVTFRNSECVNPGVLRPGWYGNCVATYGLKSVAFDNLVCRAPTLARQIKSGNSSRIDNSMFVFYTSFGAEYPAGNRIDIGTYTFTDLEDREYIAKNGSRDYPQPGKMVWTKALGGTLAPFYFPNSDQDVHVVVHVASNSLISRSTPAVAGIKKTSCPEYTDIREDSVTSDKFDIDEFEGRWFMVATSEPTLPKFCHCGVNEVSIHKDTGTYEYINTDQCDTKGFDHNISIHIMGQLSTDRASPGLLHENAALFNHTIGTLDPNYIFRVERDNHGGLEVVFTYACLGRLPPVFGPEAFSFNVLTRSPNWRRSEIEAMVTRASTSGKLNLDGLRIDDGSNFSACQLLH